MSSSSEAIQLVLFLHAKSLQSCPTVCDPEDWSPPGSSVGGFSRQQHCSGVPCLPPGGLLGPGAEPGSLTSPALAAGFSATSATWEV